MTLSGDTLSGDTLSVETEHVRREFGPVAAVDGAKKALSATVSIVDKMATKGIIHRNTAGRYKSRLTARLAKSA